ncbi:MAG: hypothetical protein ACKOAH_14300, partial [Pirellula sp.]
SEITRSAVDSANHRLDRGAPAWLDVSVCDTVSFSSIGMSDEEHLSRLGIKILPYVRGIDR